jgi:hypothetical protein
MSLEFKFNDQNLYRGEIAPKGITVTGATSITSAWYEIHDAKDESILTSWTAATISSYTLSAPIAAGDTKGQRYVLFKFFDSPYTRIAKLMYDVI